MEICDGLIERGGIGFTCPNGVRADRMNVEQVDKMARAGCEYVAIAIETATSRLQKQIKKHLRFDKVQPIISAFTERNVFTSGFFMVGFPSETEAELQRHDRLRRGLEAARGLLLRRHAVRRHRDARASRGRHERGRRPSSTGGHVLPARSTT